MASSSWACNIQGGAGAPEPGAAAVTVVEDDETVLRVAFYNVGMQQSDLDTKRRKTAEGRCARLAHDIAEGFKKHRLDLLCLCELGEHEIGLQGQKNLRCDSQEELLVMIASMVDRALDGGALEPAVQVDLVSGQYATYAALKRRGSKLAVDNVVFHRGLDTRPGDRYDRTMLTLNCRWMNEPIKITCCHCPASRKRPWDMNVRDSVLPNLFRLAGLVPFEDWSGGAAEPAAWILGGDLNLGENTIHNEMKKYQPHRGGERLVQTVEAGGLVKHHGDVAMVQHVTAFQTSSLIGRDYGGISDNHNMVIVVAKRNAQERHSGASEPTGPTASRAAAWLAGRENTGGASEPTGATGSRDAATLTEGAKQAAQSLADILE